MDNFFGFVGKRNVYLIKDNFYIDIKLNDYYKYLGYDQARNIAHLAINGNLLKE